MKKLLLVSISLLILNAPIFAEDISFSIHESTINKVLGFMNNVSDTGKTKVLGSSLRYKWTVKNPRISIVEGKALFFADVKIKAGAFKSDSKAKGTFVADYDQEKNIILLELEKASFTLIFKVFGKELKIKDIDISKHYNQRFEFAGPETLATTLELDTSSGNKTIVATSINPDVILEDGRLSLISDLEFTEQIQP